MVTHLIPATSRVIGAFIFCGLTVALTGCTHTILRPEPPKNECANIDWFEVGRGDGRLGYPMTKLKAHQAKCDATETPVETDLYANGREMGLVDFCSATGGLEAGKSGVSYQKVCPEHLESTFLANYEIGRKIQQLEVDNSDLDARINNLIQLTNPTQASGSMQSQIDQLRARRAQINNEISTLESSASTEL